MKSSILSERRRFSALVEKLEERALFTIDNYFFEAVSSSEIGLWIDTNHQGTGTPTDELGTTGSGSLNLSNAAVVTFDESAGQAIQSGGFTIYGDSTYLSNNVIYLLGTSGNDTVTSSSSAMTFGSTTVSFTNFALEYYNPSGGTDSLSVTSGTTVLTAGAVGGGIDERSLSSLNISSGAEVYVQPVQENHSDRQVLVVPGSGLTVTGSLDMTNNDMIVTSGNWGTINGKIGANGGPHGIYTDQDSNDNIYTTMGVMPNNGGSGTTAIYSTFDGISVSYSAILVKWTYGADANLDGSVNTTDYDRLVNGYDNSLTGWYNGDFNYDGVINGSDFTIYDNCEGATGL